MMYLSEREYLNLLIDMNEWCQTGLTYKELKQIVKQAKKYD
jgi:hypothetical protein